MRLSEILLENKITEVFDSPHPYSISYSDDEAVEILCPDLDLAVYLTRGLGESLEEDTVFIEFAVNGKYELTGTGNAIAIFSTVIDILKTNLTKFIKDSKIVEFGADLSEPSRVRLYRRIAPKISSILGPKWQYLSKSSPTQRRYMWVRQDLITEKAVQSSWITDITYNRPNRVLTMRLSNGRTYSIPGIQRGMFDRWTASPSKGIFFHQQIKDRYQVNRIA